MKGGMKCYIYYQLQLIPHLPENLHSSNLPALLFPNVTDLFLSPLSSNFYLPQQLSSHSVISASQRMYMWGLPRSSMDTRLHLRVFIPPLSFHIGTLFARIAFCVYIWSLFIHFSFDI